MPKTVDRTADIPPLPFGQASALEFTDEAGCCAFLARLPDAPSRFGAMGPGDGFRGRLRSISLPDVSLLAGASTAKATTHHGPRAALVIPFARCETTLRTDANEYRWAAPHHAFFIPAGQQVAAESTAGAFLRLDIVETTLARIAAGMAGLEGAPRALDLSTARVVSMQTRAAAWLPMIRSLCGTIDTLACDPARLTAAGVDDVILRTVAMMLRPGLLVEHGAFARPARGFDLDPLLERIEAHLEGRLTMAELEAWSGRTARSLQLAFQKRFGMGPMKWIRERRLDLVHAKLLAAPAGSTVREIAATCGLHRMGTMIPEYLRRFGERPSDTLNGRGRHAAG